MKLKKYKEKKERVNDGHIYDTVTKTAQLVIFVFIAMTITAYTAVGILPVLCGNILSGMGVTYDTAVLDLFALWILPCSFISLMIFVGEVVAFKVLWKFMNKQRHKIYDKHMKRVEDKKNKNKDKGDN